MRLNNKYSLVVTKFLDFFQFFFLFYFNDFELFQGFFLLYFHQTLFKNATSPTNKLQSPNLDTMTQYQISYRVLTDLISELIKYSKWRII